MYLITVECTPHIQSCGENIVLSSLRETETYKQSSYIRPYCRPAPISKWMYSFRSYCLELSTLEMLVKDTTLFHLVILQFAIY